MVGTTGEQRSSGASAGQQESHQAEKQQRHAWAMIDKGAASLSYVPCGRNMGCSRRQARRVVTEAHKEWMDLAFGDDNVDQRDLLFAHPRPERIARKAEEAATTPV